MKLAVIFPHQLFRRHPIYRDCEEIILVEEHLFFRQYPFHKLKLAFHRSSMKGFENYLLKQDLRVRYIESSAEHSDIRVLITQLVKEGAQKIAFIDPTDNWLEKRLMRIAENRGVKTKKYATRLFHNKPGELADFFKPGNKKFFQTTFYKAERQRRDILIDQNGRPTGGDWTYDVENRKKYPKKKVPPKINHPASDETWKEAVEYVNTYFPDNPGELSEWKPYPTNHEESDLWFSSFLNNRFEEFGPYEDAIVGEELYLNHSVLSPMMNVGLIEESQVVKNTLEFACKNNIPINSTEGFIRQVIGWREFIRGLYEAVGTKQRNSNHWGFERKIPPSFYDGTTGIPPVDDAIQKVLQTGYCHHIERLMILGNFMLLCEFHPREVYRWFMELFIDAYDWVMVPNVYGMSQFADGGLMSTKPYISSSNYILKMSNYPKGDWQEIWDGLFWRFMAHQRDMLGANPRLKMLLNTLSKMDAKKRNRLFDRAETFLSELE